MASYRGSRTLRDYHFWQTPVWISTDPNLTPGEKMAFSLLWTRVKIASPDTPSIEIGIGEIMEAWALGKDTVRRALRGLEEKGWIRMEKKGGGAARSLYTVFSHTDRKANEGGGILLPPFEDRTKVEGGGFCTPQGEDFATGGDSKIRPLDGSHPYKERREEVKIADPEETPGSATPGKGEKGRKEPSEKLGTGRVRLQGGKELVARVGKPHPLGDVGGMINAAADDERESVRRAIEKGAVHRTRLVQYLWNRGWEGYSEGRALEDPTQTRKWAFQSFGGVELKHARLLLNEYGWPRLVELMQTAFLGWDMAFMEGRGKKSQDFWNLPETPTFRAFYGTRQAWAARVLPLSDYQRDLLGWVGGLLRSSTEGEERGQVHG